jgi:hypothetical protein
MTKYIIQIGQHEKWFLVTADLPSTNTDGWVWSKDPTLARHFLLEDAVAWVAKLEGRGICAGVEVRSIDTVSHSLTR